MKSFAFITIAIFITSLLSAQIDAHYWTHQYGGRALLLNGAVIASTDDETAVFYNPGAMAMKEDDEFSLSLSFLTPSYSLLKVKNYFGQGRSIKDQEFRFTPGLAAIGFNPFKGDRCRLAITSFTRYQSDINFRYRTIVPVKSAENQLYQANLDFKSKLSQRWVGVGLSWRLLEGLSIGATQFVTFHSESTQLSLNQEIISTINPNDVLTGWRKEQKYSFYTHGKMVTKGGLAMQVGGIKIGLTVTTPSYFSVAQNAAYEIDDLKIFSADSLSVVTNLDDAPIQNYKTPLSVGFGLDIPVGSSRLSFSTEYFAPIKDYIIFDKTDDPLNGLGSDTENTRFTLRKGNRSVVNVALGCQTRINSGSTVIWGVRTDFNQQKSQKEAGALDFLSTTPTIIHFSLGNVLEKWNSKFSFGLDYSFGLRNQQNTQIDIRDINTENLFGEPVVGNVSSRFQSLILILAYDFSNRN